MGLNIGIIGLPNVGKSTLFKAITSQPIEMANYPFCTIEPNVGIAKVPDERLQALAKIFTTEKIIPNVVEVVDIAGLVKGASQGAGLGNKFLDNIRQVDALLEVVRCFRNDDIIHVEDDIDPIRDIDIIHTELILADLETVNRHLKREKKNHGEKEIIAFLAGLDDHLNEGKLAINYDYLDDVKLIELMAELSLLTAKPLFFVLNVGDGNDEDNLLAQKVIQYAKKQNIEAIKISAKLEEEISDLNDADRSLFLKELSLPFSALRLVIRESFKIINQITFFTAGEKEVRAWNVRKDAPLPEAAGKIHSDMQKGFIRGEVYNYADIAQQKNELALKNLGKIRIEGKNYRIKDGDIVHIRFQA
ncbi:MAG: redox-regulated ATPase YchF [SAR324 cluster bacterium]|nr:redox-regulated ATPase YchF [SAR324 cluster bacterium]